PSRAPRLTHRGVTGRPCWAPQPQPGAPAGHRPVGRRAGRRAAPCSAPGLSPDQGTVTRTGSDLCRRFPSASYSFTRTASSMPDGRPERVQTSSAGAPLTRSRSAAGASSNQPLLAVDQEAQAAYQVPPAGSIWLRHSTTPVVAVVVTAGVPDASAGSLAGGSPVSSSKSAPVTTSRQACCEGASSSRWSPR